jgi:hypothetical protein
VCVSLTGGHLLHARAARLRHLQARRGGEQRNGDGVERRIDELGRLVGADGQHVHLDEHGADEQHDGLQRQREQQPPAAAVAARQADAPGDEGGEQEGRQTDARRQQCRARLRRVRLPHAWRDGQQRHGTAHGARTDGAREQQDGVARLVRREYAKRADARGVEQAGAERVEVERPDEGVGAERRRGPAPRPLARVWLAVRCGELAHGRSRMRACGREGLLRCVLVVTVRSGCQARRSSEARLRLRCAPPSISVYRRRRALLPRSALRKRTRRAARFARSGVFAGA